MERLPFSIKILLENLLRNEDGRRVSAEDVETVARGEGANTKEISFMPARVLLQDFTGVPCVVDLAAMRDALAAMGSDPNRANPLLPADLVIDHSVQVDNFGSADAFELNAALEFQRNRERYMLLRWGQTAFRNFRVVPPDTGIVHQVNLEYLAPVVFRSGGQAYPDSVVGTDSHTTMVNGLGVLGWGVGGIEAEACMLGQPVSMLLPPVIGFKLHGKLQRRLHRDRPGADHHPDSAQEGRGGQVRGVLWHRPERAEPGGPRHGGQHGAGIRRHHGFLPGGPGDAHVSEVQQSRRRPDRAGGSLHQGAGPVPHRRDARPGVRRHAGTRLGRGDAVDGRPEAAAGSRGTAGREEEFPRAPSPVRRKPPWRNSTAKPPAIGDGAVVIAAITSCTNTSNPSVMLAAGLLAKKAVERGLKVKPWVKTSLAPGSKVVADYYRQAGLHAVPRSAQFPPGGLRLHHLHRQQRPAARGGGAGGSRRKIWWWRRC